MRKVLGIFLKNDYCLVNFGKIKLLHASCVMLLIFVLINDMFIDLQGMQSMAVLYNAAACDERDPSRGGGGGGVLVQGGGIRDHRHRRSVGFDSRTTAEEYLEDYTDQNTQQMTQVCSIPKLGWQAVECPGCCEA